MKIDELTPGVYKIRKQAYIPYGAKFARPNSNPIHLLRVEGVGEQRKYFLDDDILGQHPHNMEAVGNYEILSKYDGDPQIGNCRITISFADTAGQKFEFMVRDTWSLRHLFDAMPWLKKPFGYVTSRSKIRRN
jgi:hypothetical protein